MRRIVLLLSILAAVAAGALPAIAADDGKVQRFAQDETLGFYRGTTVAYLDFGPVKLAAATRWRRSGPSRTAPRPAQHHRHGPGPQRLHAALGGEARDLEGRADGAACCARPPQSGVPRPPARCRSRPCPSSSTAPCCRQAHQLSLHLDEAVSGESRDGLVVELRSPARLCRDEPQRACAALAEGALVRPLPARGLERLPARRASSASGQASQRGTRAMQTCAPRPISAGPHSWSSSRPLRSSTRLTFTSTGSTCPEAEAGHGVGRVATDSRQLREVVRPAVLGDRCAARWRFTARRL